MFSGPVLSAIFISRQSYNLSRSVNSINRLVCMSYKIKETQQSDAYRMITNNLSDYIN
jgi:hypothetical protein